jgi:two-component SAPR family response regulator
MQRTHRPEAVVSPKVDLRILGPVEVVSGEHRVAIEGRRTRVLLAMLLVWRNQTVSLDALIDGLWPQGPPSSAKSTLHAYISRLRSALAAAGPLTGNERINRKPPGYECAHSTVKSTPTVSNECWRWPKPPCERGVSPAPRRLCARL